jgi:hypothetical protein
MTELNETTSGRMPSFRIPTSRDRAQAEMTVLYVRTVFGISVWFIISNSSIALRHWSLLERAEMTNSQVWVDG